MSVITTHLNDNAQTPLNRYVVYMLYSQLCNKYSDKSNRWSIGLSLSVASSTVGAIIKLSSSPSSTTLLPVNRVLWIIFFTEGKIYSPVGNLAERAKLCSVREWHDIVTFRFMPMYGVYCVRSLLLSCAYIAYYIAFPVISWIHAYRCHIPKAN